MIQQKKMIKIRACTAERKKISWQITNEQILKGQYIRLSATAKTQHMDYELETRKSSKNQN